MSKLEQQKIPLTQDENGNLKIEDNQIESLLVLEKKTNWRLVREKDNLTKESTEILWLEFNEDGTFKSKHEEPAIGRSLLMSPFNMFFNWQTTGITEIVEQKEDYVKFKTKNSTYQLWKI